MKYMIVLGAALLLALIGYYAGYKRFLSPATTYILYTTNNSVGNKRIHLATFDTDYGDANKADCWQTAKLFQYEVGNEARFWCEKGR
jgi:hypothetical protein